MQGAGGGHDNRQVIAVVAGCAHMFDNIIPSLVQGGGHGNRQVIAVVAGCVPVVIGGFSKRATAGRDLKWQAV